MKRSLFFVCICLLTLVSGAQDIPYFIHQYVPYHLSLYTHKPATPNIRNGNANQLKDYLGTFTIADEHYLYGQNGWDINDSTTFFYHLAFPYPSSDTTLLYNSGNQSWTYDSILAVSSYYIPSAPVTDEDTFIGTATGQVYNGGSWTNTIQYNYSYDANQRATSRVLQTWNGSTWANVSQVAYGYNSTGALDSLSTYSYASGWQTDSQYVYVYNQYGGDSIVYVLLGNGSGGWDTAFRFRYQYAPISGVFTSIDIDRDSSGTWSNNYGQYNYYRGNNVATYLLQINNVNTYEENYTLDYRNNILSYENDTFINNVATPIVQITYSYDINNDVTSEQTAVWNAGANSYMDIDLYLYYYEWFTVVGAINDVQDQLGAKLYPNPSTGNLNISLNAESSSPLLITVYDCDGRKWTELNTQLASGDNVLPLQLTNLGPGEYLINLKNLVNGQTSTLNWVKE